MTKKTIDTLIPDIHEYLETKEGRDGLDDSDIAELAHKIALVLKNRVEERRKDEFKLRFSNFGKPDRQLWFEAHRPRNPFSGRALLNFLYGDLVEAMLLFLAEKAGHEITHEQETVELEGIEGHLDAVIDGVTVDVKSASRFAFAQKFANGGVLRGEDPYGYRYQLKGYKDKVGTKHAMFWAANKENGEMTLVPLDSATEKLDPAQRIRDVKQMLAQEEPPVEKCYQPEDYGSSGNQVLNKNCKYCPFKFECWKDANNGHGLQVYEYSKGPEFFTRMVRFPNNIPNVTERYTGFNDETE